MVASIHHNIFHALSVQQISQFSRCVTISRRLHEEGEGKKRKKKNKINRANVVNTARSVLPAMRDADESENLGFRAVYQLCW